MSEFQQKQAEEMVDIFRIVDGGVIWVEAKPDFQTATRRVNELGERAPGGYLLFDSRSDRKTFLTVPAENKSGGAAIGIPAAESILDCAMRLCVADFANLQMLNEASGGALQIVGQRNLSDGFLNFFQTVHSGSAACGTALLQGKRVIVDEVATHPAYSEDSREVMLAEGIHSLQSVPLAASSKILGIVSVHYRKPRTPHEVHMRISDSLAASFGEHLATAFSVRHV